jgi:hypothetical protein
MRWVMLNLMIDYLGSGCALVKHDDLEIIHQHSRILG